MAVLAGLALWVRAVSEMTLVVRHHLQQYPLLRGTALARDTVYGLSTSIFLFLVFYVHTESSKHSNRSALLVSAEDELRRHIKTQVDAKKPPPALKPLFNQLNEDPMSALSTEDGTRLKRQATSHDSYVEYVKALGRRFGHLEHVNLAREY
jgi:hypothetical protein